MYRCVVDHGCLLATPQGKGEGSWDSIHVFEATDRARTAHYKLTTTVILHLGSSSESLGQINLGGNMVYQKELDLPVEDDSSHIVNLGRMIEDMETKHRGMLNEVYFGKARDIIGDLRSIFESYLTFNFPNLKQALLR